MIEKHSLEQNPWLHPEVATLLQRQQEELVAAGVAENYAKNLWFSATFGSQWEKHHPSVSKHLLKSVVRQTKAATDTSPLLVARHKGGWEGDGVLEPHDTLTLYRLDLHDGSVVPGSISYWVAQVAPDDSEIIDLQTLFYTPDQALLLIKHSRELESHGILADTLIPFRLNAQ